MDFFLSSRDYPIQKYDFCSPMLQTDVFPIIP